jgi:hypothetical protein
MGTLHEVKSTGVVDFKQKGTENLVLEQGSSSPVSGVEGQLFWRTDTKQPLIHDGTDFKAILGGSFRNYAEEVNETANDVIVNFTVDHPYVVGTTEVTRDGLRMKLGDDYTESSPSTGQITFTTPPSTGSIILVSYSRVEGSSLPILQKHSATAGAGQTAFTLPFAYTPGTGSLFVYSSGMIMLVGGSADYVETDSTTITFNTGRQAGEAVQFIHYGAANDASTSGWVDAGSYVQLSSTSDQVRIGQGSAATPALAFYNDTDTGWFGLADNSMRLSIGGNQRFIFDANAINPGADNTYRLGTSPGGRWSDVRSVLINGADYGFQNGYV